MNFLTPFKKIGHAFKVVGGVLVKVETNPVVVGIEKTVVGLIPGGNLIAPELDFALNALQKVAAAEQAFAAIPKAGDQKKEQVANAILSGFDATNSILQPLTGEQISPDAAQLDKVINLAASLMTEIHVLFPTLKPQLIPAAPAQ